MIEATYKVSTWDSERWQTYAKHLTKWQVRTALRELYAWGYTQISIQVKSETHRRPAARFARGFIASTTLPKSVRRKLMAKASEEQE